MKKIAIIGGGIAGLSTGCYAQMNGFQSEIYEMHSLPGGVCTSWKRGDFLFDHCLHWVLGSNTNTNLYPIFKELGISDNIQFHYPEIFRVIHLSDKTLTAYTNIDKF
jgi:phytoene dehydrogenase-like protein